MRQIELILVLHEVELLLIDIVNMIQRQLFSEHALVDANVPNHGLFGCRDHVAAVSSLLSGKLTAMLHGSRAGQTRLHHLLLLVVEVGCVNETQL